MSEKEDSIFLDDISEHVDMNKLMINETNNFTHKISDLNNLIRTIKKSEINNVLRKSTQMPNYNRNKIIQIENPNSKLSSSLGKLNNKNNIKNTTIEEKNENIKRKNSKPRINSCSTKTNIKKNNHNNISPNFTKKISKSKIIKISPLNTNVDILNSIHKEDKEDKEDALKTLCNTIEKNRTCFKKTHIKNTPKKLVFKADIIYEIKKNDSNKKINLLNNNSKKNLSSDKKIINNRYKNIDNPSNCMSTINNCNKHNRFYKNKTCKEHSLFNNSSHKNILKNNNTNIKLKNQEQNEIIPNENNKNNKNNKKNEISKTIDDFQKNNEIQENIKTTKTKNILSKSVKTQLSKNKIKTIYEIKSHYADSQSGKNEKGQKKTNQDTYIYIEKINGIKNFDIFGVLDGHGTEGHLVSQFISNYIINEITQLTFLKKNTDLEYIYQKLKNNNYEKITNLFLNANNSLKNELIDYMNSGTTCILIFHIGIHIICANSGDSRAIFVYDEKNSQNLNNLKVFALSTDCKPELKEEKKRILQNGGEVKRPYNFDIGPYRVWVKGKNYPGLAMSRSIGDFCGKDIGIIADPIFMDICLSVYSKYIIVCSDGVWEFLSNEDVMNLGKKFYIKNDPSGFGIELIKIATNMWEKEDCIVDDITAVIVFF